jgi:hypothetical protein
MTRLQEAQEWAGRLERHGHFFYCWAPGTQLYSTLDSWDHPPRLYMASLDTRLLALAFAATAPKEFR